MAGETQPKVADAGGIKEMLTLFGGLNQLFGSGKTSSTQTTSADPTALNQLDEILKQIMQSVSPESLDALVANILQKGKQEFGQFAMASRGAGVRAYSDTVLQQMGGEYYAKAVADATKARLDAVNAANRTAADLAARKVEATRTTTQEQRTGASPAGMVIGGGVLATNLYSFLKKRGLLGDSPDAVDAGTSSVTGSEVDMTGGTIGTGGAGEFGVEGAYAGGFDEAGFEGAFMANNALAMESSGLALDISDPFAAGEQIANPIVTEAPVSGEILGGEAAEVAATSSAEAAAPFINITPEQVITPLPMPPAIPVNPATGDVIPSMPPAILDTGGAENILPPEGIDVAAGGNIMTDVGPGLLEGAGETATAGEIGAGAVDPVLEEMLAEVAGEAGGEVATEAAASEVVGGSVPAGAIVNTGMKAAYGDEGGAIGSGVGAVIGSAFGPLGTAAGSIIGGEIAGDEKREIAYVYDNLRDRYWDPSTQQFYPGRPPEVARPPMGSGSGPMSQVFNMAQETGNLSGTGPIDTLENLFPQPTTELTSNPAISLGLTPDADPTSWMADVTTGVTVADFVAEATMPALSSVEPVEIEEEELPIVNPVVSSPYSGSSSGGGAVRPVLR